ncbi:MAG: thioredoxin family protein [Flavobacteriia bacterium]|nr:thioredoxin family protein [Flavobacteriia bacterium]
MIQRTYNLLFIFLFSLQWLFAQPGGDWTDKISWSFSIKKVDESTAKLIAQAKLKTGWHVFSVNHDPNKADMTGYPTKFSFSPNSSYRLLGKLKDGTKAKVHTDDLGTSLYFENIGFFIQEIEILDEKSFDLEFDYAFQICDENGCIFPPDQSAKIKISGFAPKNKQTSNILPENKIENIPDTIIETQENKTTENETVIKNKKSKTEVKESFWLTFLKGFGGGLIALLTPCVFPMIPMTVTFFTKKSKKKIKGIIDALIYGISIIVIYVTIGLLITAIMGPSGLNDLSTNVWMNLIFFAIFMIFAFSFLGAFEIRLPNSWVNKADGKADKGGLIGIFFMAFTLSLVSFSCTGPIIGTLLVESASSGSLMGPAIGMAGFAIALAIPFTLFAIFPGWLQSLPKSGGWLNSVKVVLGLLELALALKFLSGIDLAYHWDVLTREIFVACWVIIFILIGVYLLGKIRFSHDSPVEKLTVTRFMFALSALIFALYLLPGMWGAPLRLIDGVAPPREHSEDNFKFVRGSGEISTNNSDPVFQEYRNLMHEVGDGSILVFHDLDKAKEYASKVKKPMLLDFTGYNCPNCRRTESTIWTNQAISPILKNELIIVSLYVDDRQKLPKSEWKYSEAIKGMIKTVGNKWSDYQVRKYGQLSQPLYIVTDFEGNDLSEAIGYTPDIETYKNFLLEAVKSFKKTKK